MIYKTIYFFKLDIKRYMTPYYVSESEFYNIFDKLFHVNSFKLINDPIWGEVRSCLISNSLVFDVLEHNSNYLFGTIGCTKSENKLRRIRNISNLEHKSLTLDANNTFEDYTFFLLDYSIGIISVINTKGAPDIKSLANLVALDPNFEAYIFSIKNRNIPKALHQFVDIGGVELKFALPPDEVFGSDGEQLGWSLISKFKNDGFESTELRLSLDRSNSKRKSPTEIASHILEAYEIVKDSNDQNNSNNKFKLKSFNITGTPYDEIQKTINLLELHFTKGVKFIVEDSFSEKSIKDQIELVYNNSKAELLNNIFLHTT